MNFQLTAFLTICCLLTLCFIFVPLLNFGLIFAEVEMTKNGGAETTEEEVLPVWQRTWNWTKNYWKDNLWPRIAEFYSFLAQSFTQAVKEFWEKRIRSPIEEEGEKRKEIIEERVEKEKKEIEEKFISETNKSIWEKIKDFWE